MSIKKVFFTSLILFSAVLLSACSIKNLSTPANSPTPTPISTNLSDSNKINYPCLKGQTAFDSLSSSGNKIEFKESSLGKMITSINNIAQSNGKYWQYSIDDKYAEVGADVYKCNGNETITWELK